MSLNEKFIINLQGKSYITYEGLLNLAHQRNLKSIEVELIQVPTDENNMTAICRATAMTENQTYADLGDASPQSVNSTIAPHIIRMASTRAKARVLRDLNNIGLTAIEELSYDESIDNSRETHTPSFEDAPTKRQLETIKKLSDELNLDIDYNSLTKKTAGSLISRMLDEVKR